MRKWMVLAHRYAGLLLATFLAVAGVTGSLLAWNAELDAAISPSWFHAAPAGAHAKPLHPLVLRDIVQARYPDTLVLRVPLLQEEGRSAVFLLRAKPGAAQPANDQVFVDPYAGHTLGERRWGDITQGLHNLMPFVYRLHYSLALGTVGTVLLGIVSLLWMVDCIVGAILTFPLSQRGRPATDRHQVDTVRTMAAWLMRWWSAWKISTKSTYRAVFGTHRSGGLWAWPALFILAWSSVALNLPQIHDPLMRALSAHQPGMSDLPRRDAPLWRPRLNWSQALDSSRQHMAQQAQLRGFVIHGESSLSYDPRRGVYRYDVRSSLDLKDKGGSTRLFTDGNTGILIGTWLPTGAAAGDTVTTWLVTLHMAALWGVPMKVLVTLLGLAVAVLSVTGVVIWARKRKGRKLAALRSKLEVSAFVGGSST